MISIINISCRLQVLRSDSNPQTHWVFRAWGRIGTEIGGNKVERYPSVHGAVGQFKELFFEKTGNEWGTAKEDFEKLPFKFYPLEMDYGEVCALLIILSISSMQCYIP